MALPDDPAKGWRIVVKDPAHEHNPKVRALFEEAWAAAPLGFVGEDTVKVLPRKSVDGRCRLCGRERKLTKEHVPPKASGNMKTARSHSIDDWLQRTHNDDMSGGKHEQGGVFGYTLCGSCNSYTGAHYGAEYGRWADMATATLDGLPHPLDLDQLTKPLGWKLEADSKEDGCVSHGAMVRQVLSCFCTLSGTWDLAERHPGIRHIVLEQSLEAMPNGMELTFILYYGPNIRMAGPTLMVEPEKGEWRWIMELAYPPLAFLCVIASNVAEPGIGLMMNDWTSMPVGDRVCFEGIVRLGFGWTALPADYRTRAAIRSECSPQSADAADTPVPDSSP